MRGDRRMPLRSRLRWRRVRLGGAKSPGVRLQLQRPRHMLALPVRVPRAAPLPLGRPELCDARAARGVSQRVLRTGYVQDDPTGKGPVRLPTRLRLLGLLEGARVPGALQWPRRLHRRTLRVRARVEGDGVRGAALCRGLLWSRRVPGWEWATGRRAVEWKHTHGHGQGVPRQLPLQRRLGWTRVRPVEAALPQRLRYPWHMRGWPLQVRARLRRRGMRGEARRRAVGEPCPGPGRRLVRSHAVQRPRLVPAWARAEYRAVRLSRWLWRTSMRHRWETARWLVILAASSTDDVNLRCGGQLLSSNFV